MSVHTHAHTHTDTFINLVSNVFVDKQEKKYSMSHMTVSGGELLPSCSVMATFEHASGSEDSFHGHLLPGP